MNITVEILGQQRLLLTDCALEKIRSLVGSTEQVFCITVEPGGCNGFEYHFDIKDYKTHECNGLDDKEPLFALLKDRKDALLGITSGEYYKIYDAEKPLLVIDNTSLKLIENSKLDYVMELISEKFVIKNPNSKSSCSCGASFGI